MEENKNLLAILGPTNTGKTFVAFDRLVSYKSGIFGFPLRLLARENYDKAVKKLGYEKVALITGEEKILPKKAMYYFCTVESMPLNIQTECVAIDEIQLASDYERGHIFTDHILNLRGTFETIFLGSIIIEKILLKLFPKIKIEKRDRFSRLSYLPKNSLSKLNPRSAIISFNLNSVYEIAESLRAYKGGAAVVLGSLSPRTRNAQVEVYEDKKVDYLVATDAIGMGLNLNINHVSFSALQKFDGRNNTNLTKAELGQIAGRAGRYQNDGSFSYLKNAVILDPLTIQSIEDHNYDFIEKIYWRNSKIDFSTVESVINSFKVFPTRNFFIHKKNAADEINFRLLSDDLYVKPFLENTSSIKLLWNICRIPDFQKIFNDTYLDLLKNIFLTLIKNNGAFPDEWLKEKIIKLENYSGGIDELSIKIANIRTWTYIANQSKWINDYEFWQKKTQEIENNLSDYLHISLTNRFVDFSASYFTDIRNRGEETIVDVDENKCIKLNGQKYGYISGFNLELNIPNSESLYSLNHVKKSIRIMIEEKINNFLNAPIDAINLGDINKHSLYEKTNIYWGDEPIGRIQKGLNIYSPKVEALNSEFLDSDKKILISKKLQDWLDKKIISTLKPIKDPIEESISSDVRAIIFNLFNNLGTMLVKDYFSTIKNLNEHEKACISRAGIRMGAKFFFMPNLLKKNSMELKALLWKNFYLSNEKNNYPLPKDGRVSFNTEIQMPDSYWSAIGYKCLDNFAVRVDVFERVFFLARQKIKYGPFFESADMMNPIGCNSNQLSNILEFCGFKNIKLIDDKNLFYLNSKKQNVVIKTKVIKNKIIKTKVIKNKIIKTKVIKNKIIKTKVIKDKVIDLKDKKNIKPRKDNIFLKKTKIVKDINKEADPNSPFAVLEKLL